ncbi:energy-coupling factor transporter transmembrane component T family protein [Brachybacterium sp. AOP35-5H-19]|uniref:energy-coupling factor transporter transmembrane component T family protein n=1 Tax=Brachybacterium sp. AOP35-5H-19 TaxID=3457685 RepID=UPI003FB88DF5
MSPAAAAQRPLLHPIAVLVLPLPAILAVLFADGIDLALACILASVAASFGRGARFAAGVLALAATTFLLVGIGFSLSAPTPEQLSGERIEWLPLHPSVEKAFFAVRGALRMTAVVVLYVVTVRFVQGNVLADSLIDRFSAPYRVIDVLGLGRRFTVLIRRDVAAACSIARLRSRGRPLRTMRLLTGLTIPVLMASFRHADELSIAMDARGFGALPRRTVHWALPLRMLDGVAVVGVWAATILAAVMLS